MADQTTGDDIVLDDPSKNNNAVAGLSLFVNCVDSYSGSVIARSLLDGDDFDTNDANNPQSLNCTITGTRKRSNLASVDAGIQEVPSSGPEYEQALLKCDCAVFSIVDDIIQIEQAEEALRILTSDAAANSNRPRAFVLISSHMTWALSEVDEEFPTLTDDDYFERRAHPFFKDHLRCEKQTLKARKKGLLDTYVVTSGMLYGCGEGPLRHLMKSAWEQPEYPLAVLGEGGNMIPTLHVQELPRVVKQLALLRPNQSHFIICDDKLMTQKEIVESIANAVNPTNNDGVPFGEKPVEMTTSLSLAEGYLIDDLDSLHMEMLTTDVRMGSDTVTLKSELDCVLGKETGGGLNIHTAASLFSEFVEKNTLTSIKICVNGPPAVGKTTLATRISNVLQLELLNEESIMRSQISKLEGSKKALEVLPSEDTVEDCDKEAYKLRKAQLTEARDKIAKLYPSATTATTTSDGENDDKFSLVPADKKLYEELLIEGLHAKVNSLQCKLHGFVLDGFPRSEKEAIQIFGTAVDVAEACRPQDFPVLLELQASDDYLVNRILELPESEFASNYSIETGGLAPALKAYHAAPVDSDHKGRKGSAVDSTAISGAQQIVNYFHQISESLANTVDGQEETVEEEEAKTKISTTVFEINVEDKHKEEVVRMSISAIKDRISNMYQADQLDAAVNQVEVEEKEIRNNNQETPHTTSESEVNTDTTLDAKAKLILDLETASQPAREYVSAKVLPTLTQALIEVANVQPDDPIAFIAERLSRK